MNKLAIRLVAVWMLTIPAHAAPGESHVDQYSVVANGETVGHIDATRSGASLDVDYAVSNNGRGPRHQEHLTLNAKGVPVSWTIDGTSLMGGSVHEQETWKDAVQSWVSQADHGEIRTPAPQLYIGDDASPWALGMYAKVLLKAPNNTLNVLPGGTLKLNLVRPITVGTDKNGLTVNAYFLTGIELDPQILLLDRRGDLFGVLGDESLVVRKGFEKYYSEFLSIASDLTRERFKALQARVAHNYDTPVRIRSVHVFDPTTEQMSALESVVVFRGHITTVEPEAPSAPPSDETIIDGQGGYLVAGLHDMHSHNSMSTGPLNIAAGVTTVRDMGNINTTFLELMK
jgi:hypothetical protein